MVFFPLARFLTDAGDSGVLLPLALVGVGTLWFFHSRRLAWLLLRSVLAAGALITVLKVLFLSCGAHWASGLSSPSGHACLSAVVYGTLATLISAGRPPAARVAIHAAAIAFVAVVAVSRVMLGVHTWLEVAVGLGVGVLAQAWFAWSYAHMEPLRLDLRVFGVTLVATMLVAFGIRLPAESIIRHLAKRLGEKCAAIGAEPAAQRARAAAALAGGAQPLFKTARTSSARSRAV